MDLYQNKDFIDLLNRYKKAFLQFKYQVNNIITEQAIYNLIKVYYNEISIKFTGYKLGDYIIGNSYFDFKIERNGDILNIKPLNNYSLEMLKVFL